jgi:hypothetical protein
MAKRTTKRGGVRAGGRRTAGAGKAKEGAACPEELNLPSPSREDYVGTALEQVGEFEERLAELETDLESTGWELVGDYRSQLEDLRQRLKAARAKSAELEAIPDKDWPSAYEEMEETLLGLADSLEDFALEAGRVLPE